MVSTYQERAHFQTRRNIKVHPSFADWYRFCTSGASTPGELLEKRWAGVENLSSCETVGPTDLVRIMLAKKVATDLIVKFRQPFKEADVGFFMANNDLEVRVLAGSVLCAALASGGTLADQVALALLSATSLGGDPPWCSDFIAVAQEYMAQRLAECRRRPQFMVNTLPARVLKGHFESLATALSGNAPAESSAAAKQIGESLSNLLSNFAVQVGESIKSLKAESELRREESDVLWWMTSRVSRDLSKPFSQLKQLASLVVAGKELADLVSPPGVLPARALLMYVVPPSAGSSAGKHVSISAAVNATAEEWRAKVNEWAAAYDIADLCPILNAISHSLSGGKWEAAYKKFSGVDASQTFDPIEISLQMHRECLLVKSFS